MADRYRWAKGAIIALWGICAAGCWDRVEIEQRGFVVGIAIDEKQQPQRQDSDAGGDGQSGSPAKHRFILTYQFVNPEAMQGGGQSSGGKQNGSGGGKPMLNITSEAETLLTATRDMAAKTGRSPYIEHLKMIILSDRLARAGHLGPILDLYLRDSEARRGTKIFVMQGDPSQALEIDPQNEKLPVLLLDSIAGNVRKNGMMLSETRIGDIHSRLLTNESFAVPRIIVRGKQAKMTGAAIFNGFQNKLVGFLDAQETEALNYLTGRMKSDVIDVQTEGGLVSYESKRLKRKVTAKTVSPDEVEFTISLRSNGGIGESLSGYDYKKQGAIEEIERKAAEQIESRCRQLIGKLQRQYKSDVLGLGKHLHRYHPKVWRRVKNNWDHGETLFADCRIKVEVTVKVREYGAIHKAQKYRNGG